MLTVRETQLALLARLHEQTFRENLADHLQRHFPDETRALSREALLARVEEIVSRGRSHGLASERDLVRYAGVIVANEIDYQASPEPPWALQILDDRAVKDPSQRVDRLSAASIQRFQIEAKAFDDRGAYYRGTAS